MKRLLSFLLLILASQSSFSQSSWYLQNTGIISNLHSIHFATESKGWAAGENGKVLRTIDGGEIWQLQSLGNDKIFRSVFFVNEYTGYLCGGHGDSPPEGYLYKTTNSGVNWIEIDSYNTSAALNVFFLNETTGFMALDNTINENRGYLSKTNDAALNWYSFLFSDFTPYEVTFKNINTGWIVKNSRINKYERMISVDKTTDGGSSWFTSVIPHYSYNYEKVSIVSKSSNVWYTGGNFGIRYSHDDGITWNNAPVNYSMIPQTLFFINENTGWAAGIQNNDSTNVIKTTNAGITWFKSKNNFGYYVSNRIFFINPNTGWMACNNGIIVKTINGGTTAVNNDQSLTADEFYLGQNYPNPFNPSSTIHYNVTRSGFVEIKVYNVTGNLVRTLVKQKLIPGNYETHFEGKALTGGVYFYSLLFEGKVLETKAMILVK